MVYEITRTSDWWGENQPCKSALKADGKWYVEINTLEELQELIKNEGQIIIGKSSIEIYDGYRE